MSNAQPEQVTCSTICPGDVHRAIIKALARHAVDQAKHLDVCAFGGEVIVVGDVGSSEEKQVLLAAARRVPGVSRVKSLVRVREP
jgi:osmotically-inducible protein OsmY